MCCGVIVSERPSKPIRTHARTRHGQYSSKDVIDIIVPVRLSAGEDKRFAREKAN